MLYDSAKSEEISTEIRELKKLVFGMDEKRSINEDSWAGKKTWDDFDCAARNEVVNAHTVCPVLCHYCFATVCKKINNRFHVKLRFRNIVSKDTFSLSFTRHSFGRSFFSMAILWHTQ